MKDHFKLDKINLEIIKFIKKNGKISYTELGKKLGISNVAIKKRYKSLMDSGMINYNIDINISKLNFNVIMILLEIDVEGKEQILEIYKKCPRLIYSFEMLGEYNHMLILYTENSLTHDTIIKNCWLYKVKGVRKSTIHILNRDRDDIFLPLRFELLGKDLNESPCNNCCAFCEKYEDGSCVGCPSTHFYRGPLKIT